MNYVTTEQVQPNTFTAEQVRRAICITCPYQWQTDLTFACPCQKKSNDCILEFKKYPEEILAVCHFLMDEDLHYFGIKN